MHEQMISVANPGTLLLSGRIRIHEACHVMVSGNLWKTMHTGQQKAEPTSSGKSKVTRLKRTNTDKNFDANIRLGNDELKGK